MSSPAGDALGEAGAVVIIVTTFVVSLLGLFIAACCVCFRRSREVVVVLVPGEGVEGGGAFARTPSGRVAYQPCPTGGPADERPFGGFGGTDTAMAPFRRGVFGGTYNLAQALAPAVPEFSAYGTTTAPLDYHRGMRTHRSMASFLGTFRNSLRRNPTYTSAASVAVSEAPRGLSSYASVSSTRTYTIRQGPFVGAPRPLQESLVSFQQGFMPFGSSLSHFNTSLVSSIVPPSGMFHRGAFRSLWTLARSSSFDSPLSSTRLDSTQLQLRQDESSGTWV